MRRALISVLTITLTVAGVSNAVSGADLDDIMPLGDSITAGFYVSGGYRVNEAPARLDGLICLISDTTTGLEPDATLPVASVIPSTNSTTEANVVTFNATIPGIVSRHQAAGENVHFVDMYAALNPAIHLADGPWMVEQVIPKSNRMPFANLPEESGLQFELSPVRVTGISTVAK